MGTRGKKERMVGVLMIYSVVRQIILREGEIGDSVKRPRLCIFYLIFVIVVPLCLLFIEFLLCSASLSRCVSDFFLNINCNNY